MWQVSGFSVLINNQIFCLTRLRKREGKEGTYNACSHLMARSDLLCGLHKVCSHNIARSDLFICPRESSACHVVRHMFALRTYFFWLALSRNVSARGIVVAILSDLFEAIKIPIYNT